MSWLLLDTNVVVWLLLSDRQRVPANVVTALEDERNDVAVSAASVWEIAVKRSLGKLVIADGWTRRLFSLGFGQMPITATHAEAVEGLPWHHRDPFDRLLVAQALVEGRTLVSSDSRLEAYGIAVLW